MIPSSRGGDAGVVPPDPVAGAVPPDPAAGAVPPAAGGWSSPSTTGPATRITSVRRSPSAGAVNCSACVRQAMGRGR